MPSRQRISPCVKASTPSKLEKFCGFVPYSPRKMVTRNRTVNYREPDSESDDEVIYVGQRTKAQRQRGVPIPTLPKITLGEEEYLEEPIIKEVKKPRTLEAAAEDRSIAEFIFKGQYAAEDVAKEQLPLEVAFKEQCSTKLVVQKKDRALFQTLPYEIHQNIAGFLQDDFDINIYAKLCKQTRDSISPSVWRKRFAETFDIPERDFEPLALAKKYAYRRDIAGWICFDIKKYGAISREIKAIQEGNTKKCLSVLRELIIESNARKAIDTEGNQYIVGLNHDYMRNWVTHGRRRHTDVVDAILNTEKTSWDHSDVISANAEDSLVLVIQLCLTSLSLHPDNCNSTVSHFDMSQREAYTDIKKQPVFVGGWKQAINVRWLLHTVNFFKLHLKASSGEGLLAQQYEELERDQLPQPWLGRIKEGSQPIGSHWKTAHTFMKDNGTLLKLRLHGNDDEPMVDDGDLFSDLAIFFDDSKFSAESWPKAFETLIKSNPYTTSPQIPCQTRAGNAIVNTKYELKSFYGTSRGTKTAHCYGRIHGLPEQQGIPGFQRISLIKFFPHEGEYDPCNVWAYEGCVLPGSRIIVGRWWDLTADPRDPVNIFGGPFIWWNVDNSAAEPQISPEEALEFLESIHDPNMGFA